VAQKRLNFCCTCLKMQTVTLNLKVQMWILWPWNTSSKLRHHCTYKAHGPINPRMSYTPATLRWFSWKGDKLFLNQKRKLYQRKRYPRRNWRNKNLRHGDKLRIKVNANKSYMCVCVCVCVCVCLNCALREVLHRYPLVEVLVKEKSNLLDRRHFSPNVGFRMVWNHLR
jgi:hypothetical protein